jgi:hypothetical protein
MNEWCDVILHLLCLFNSHPRAKANGVEYRDIQTFSSWWGALLQPQAHFISIINHVSKAIGDDSISFDILFHPYL